MKRKLSFLTLLLIFCSTMFGQSHWTVNENTYNASMTVLSYVEIYGEPQNDASDASLEIAAFCGDEVRGVANLKYNQFYDAYAVLMLIYGDTPNELITFKLYDPLTDTEYTTDYTLKYRLNGSVGVDDEPITIDFVEYYWEFVKDNETMPYSMTIMSTASIDDILLNRRNFDIAAFCGDELRGVGRQQKDGIIYFAIWGDGTETEDITFKLYDHSDGTLYERTDYSVPFEINNILGDIANPVNINFTTKPYVAQIGTVKYETLAEAFEAAQNGDVVEILVAGTYELATSGKNITITGAVDGVVFDNIGAKNMGGANVTFNNVTFDYYPNANYTGLQHSGNLVYNNCTINGQVFLYGTSETFSKCTFNQNSADAYNVWTYGAKEVAFNECTFNSVGKSVLIYNESESVTNDVTVTDCDFIASAPVDGKAAIEMDSSLQGEIKLTVDAATTVTGFGTGNVSGNSLWNNKKGNETEANNDITVIVDDETVLAPLPLVAMTADDKNHRFTSLQAAYDAVAADGTITILNSVEGLGLVINKNVTIDFAGFTYTFNEGVGSTGTETNGLQILNGNTVVLKNGTLNVAESAKAKFYILVQNYANLTVDGMKLDGTNLDKYSGTDGDSYALSNNSGTVEIKGATEIIANDQGAKAFAFDVCKYASYAAPVVNVTGAEVYVNGAIEVHQDIPNNLNISAGTFTNEIEEAWCAEGYIPTQNTDGTWTVKAGKYVAQINDGAKYETLAEAFEAAQNGDVVEILVAGTYELATSGKNITITGAVDGVVFDNIGAKNMGGANVTFNNVTFDYYPNANYTGLQHSGNLVYNNCTINGQVFLYGTSETFSKCTFNQNSADAYNVWTYGAKEVAFNECTFNSVGKSVLIYNESESVTNDVTVTDCDFIASAPVDGKAAIEMDSSLQGEIKLTVDAATTVTGFGTGNVSGNSLWNNKKGNETEANNDITVIVDDETVLAPLPLVAMTADDKNHRFTSLQAAYDAVAADGTITILNSVEGLGLVINKNVTIDFAGFTYTFNEGVGSTGTETNGLQILNGNTVVLKNGTLNVAESAKAKFYILVQNYANLTVDGMKLDGTNLDKYSGTDGDSYVLSNNSGTVNIIGKTEIIANNEGDKAFAFDVCKYANYADPVVNVTGAEVKVNGAIEVHQDIPNNLNISAGTFTVEIAEAWCADGFIPKDNGDGTWTVKAGKYVARIGEIGYETLAEAIAAIGAGDVVIELLDNASLDITAWQTLAIGGDNTTSITIDGDNGEEEDFTLTFNKLNSDWNHVATSNDNATKLILKNLKLADSGYNNGPWNRYDIVFASDVELTNVVSAKALAFKADATLNNVTINESGDNYAIWIQPNGQSVTIDGLVINSAGRGIKVDEQYVTAQNVSLSVANATFETAKKAAIMVKSSAETTITVGENVNIDKVAADQTNIAWVDEDAAAHYGKVTVTGGTLTQENLPVFVAALMNNAKVEGYYKVFEEALAAAEDEKILVLKTVVFDTDKTIDFGGKEVNSNVNPAFRITNGATVIVKNGNMNTAEGYNFILGASDSSSAGNLTIESGKFHGATTVASVTMGSLNITGGEFSVEPYQGNYAFLINCYDPNYNNGAEVSISGGTFHKWNPENNAAEGAGTNFCAPGHVAVYDAVNDTYTVIEANYVAKIGEVKYTSLQAAIDAVKNAETINIIANIDENVNIVQTEGLSFTIDGQIDNTKVQYTGTISIDGNEGFDREETLNIKNINFYNEVRRAAQEAFDFIDAKSGQSHNVTVESCDFTDVYANGKNYVKGADVKEANNWKFVNCTANEKMMNLLHYYEGSQNLVVNGGTVKAYYGIHIDSSVGGLFDGVAFESAERGFTLDGNTTGEIINTLKNVSFNDIDAPISLHLNNADQSIRVFNIEGNVTSESSGNFTNDEQVKYVLTEVNATLQAQEGLNVTTSVAGHIVDYADGKYYLRVPNYVAAIGETKYESLQAAIDAAVDNDVIVVIDNIEVTIDVLAGLQLVGSNHPSYYVVRGKTISIDLNGMMIKANVSATDMLLGLLSTEQGGNLTLKDSSNGNGKVEIVAANDADVYSLITNYDSSSAITIDGGNYILNKVGDSGQSLIYDSPGKMVVNGGNFYLGNLGQGVGNVNENGIPWIFNVKGQYDGHVTVNGGTFNADVNHQHWASEVNVPNTLALKDNGNGTWTVVPAVAQGTDSWRGYNRPLGYASIADAAYWATAETTVTVVANHAATVPAVVERNLTLDMNAKAVTAQNIYPVVRIQKGASLTVTGAGSITNNDYVFVLGASDSSSAGNLTIENGTFHGATTVASVTMGNLNITGGEFSVEPYQGSYEFLINCIDANYNNGAEVSISGGTFHKWNPENNAAEGANTNFCADGYVAVYDAEHETYTVIEANYVAKIGEVKYESLQAAINAAQNGDEIDVIDNITLGIDDADQLCDNQYKSFFNVNGKTITIDLNGYTVKAILGGDLAANDVFALVSTENESNLTIKDSSVEKTGTMWIDNVIEVYSLVFQYDNSIVTIESGNYKLNVGGNGRGMVYSNDDEKVTVNGGNFWLGNVGALSNGSPWIFNASGQNTRNIIVNGGTFNDDVLHQFYPFEVMNSKEKALQNNGDGTWTMVDAVAYVDEQHKSGQYYTNYVGFATLEEAFAAAQTYNQDGNYVTTVTMLANVTAIAPIVVEDDVKFNMNAKAVTAQNIYPVVRVQNGASLTVTGAGSITNNDYVFVLGASDGSSAGNLTIESGTFHGATTVASVTKGLLTITGGDFSVEPYEGSYAFLINCIDANYEDGLATVSISGGTFHNWNPENNAAEGAGTNFCAQGYGAIENTPNVWTVIPKQTMTAEVKKGWNWFSYYVEGDVLDQLQNSLGTVGVQIKSRTQFTQYSNDGTWYGELVSTTPAESYKINVNADAVINVTGNIVNPSECPIMLNNGGTGNGAWNWIGYPLAQETSVATAFAGVVKNGDEVKTRTGFAEYVNGQWWGSLMTLKPGVGYMYFRAGANETVSNFTYPTPSSKEAVQPNITADANLWVPNSTSYANNMTMVAVLNMNGEMMNDNYEVAAMVNGEVRGSARPIYVEPMDAYMLFLTIHGEGVEEVTFQCYDFNTDTEYVLNNTINYSDDARLGSVNEPYVLCYGTMGIGENAMNTINIYPNPTTTGREINLGATCDKVEVYNALGVKVAEYQDVDTLDAIETAGIYVIRVTNDGDVKHCRLVVK